MATGLDAERFKTYFAEFCIWTYSDEKYDFSRGEMEQYFSQIHEKLLKKIADRAEADYRKEKKITTEMFCKDLCSNLSLMYHESGEYSFIHRSFQEYFCALAISRKSDAVLYDTVKYILKIEDDTSFKAYDSVMQMVYEMIPDKTENFILLPYLKNKVIFDQCDREEGYWRFLGRYYPTVMVMSAYNRSQYMLHRNRIFRNGNEKGLYSFIYKNYLRDIIHPTSLDAYFKDTPECFLSKRGNINDGEFHDLNGEVVLFYDLPIMTAVNHHLKQIYSEKYDNDDLLWLENRLAEKSCPLRAIYHALCELTLRFEQHKNSML